MRQDKEEHIGRFCSAKRCILTKSAATQQLEKYIVPAVSRNLATLVDKNAKVGAKVSARSSVTFPAWALGVSIMSGLYKVYAEEFAIDDVKLASTHRLLHSYIM